MKWRRNRSAGCGTHLPVRPLILAGVLAVLPLSFAVAQDSHYTRHDYGNCEEAPSPEPGIINVRRCVGFYGIAVAWISEPDSSSVQFGDNPLEEYLDLGAAFEVGTTIEWRTGAGHYSLIASTTEDGHWFACGVPHGRRVMVNAAHPTKGSTEKRLERIEAGERFREISFQLLPEPPPQP